MVRSYAFRSVTAQFSVQLTTWNIYSNGLISEKRLMKEGRLDVSVSSNITSECVETYVRVLVSGWEAVGCGYVYIRVRLMSRRFSKAYILLVLSYV